jgi:hypothetical protein
LGLSHNRKSVSWYIDNNKSIFAGKQKLPEKLKVKISGLEAGGIAQS